MVITRENIGWVCAGMVLLSLVVGSALLVGESEWGMFLIFPIMFFAIGLVTTMDAWGYDI